MEILITLFVVCVVSYFVKGLFGAARKPQEQSSTFICNRCANTTPHSGRTIKAWQDGFRKIMCNQCHRIWLAEQKAKAKQAARNRLIGLLLLVIVAAVFFILSAQ